MKPVLALFWHGLAQWRRHTLAGVVGVVLGSVVGFSSILWGNRADSVVFTNVYELDGTATRQGRIDIVLNINRTRVCPAEVSRWLWTWVDNHGIRTRQFFPLPGSSGALSSPGAGQHIIVSLPLPSGIWPGEWYYFSRTVEHCSFFPWLFQARMTESPQVPIQVTGDLVP